MGMEPETEPEFITVDVVKQLIANSLEKQREEYTKLLEKQLAQQKVHYEELLEKQTNAFSKMMQVVLESTNERSDKAIEFTMELKTSLQFTQNEVDNLKKDTRKLAETNAKLSVDTSNNEKDMKTVCDCIKMLDRKAEYQENQSRRNNLVIDGIEESERESWEVTEEKVRSLIENKLKLDGRIMPIERAHRMGRPDTSGGRQRPIVVKFLNYRDRCAILENAKKLKNTKIYINEDFSAQVREKRKELLPLMRAARERGEIAYLRYDQLITHPARGGRGSNSRVMTSTPSQQHD